MESGRFVVMYFRSMACNVLMRFLTFLVGAENIPIDERILYIAYHSTHNLDLLPILSSIYNITGDLPQSLTHKLIVFFNPWLRLMGCIPGTRDSALNAYEKGQSCFVLPGGGEEAGEGFENAYSVKW